jgi:hypothetical protein
MKQFEKKKYFKNNKFSEKFEKNKKNKKKSVKFFTVGEICRR